MLDTKAKPEDFQELFRVNPLAKAQLEAIIWRRLATELEAQLEETRNGQQVSDRTA